MTAPDEAKNLAERILNEPKLYGDAVVLARAYLDLLNERSCPSPHQLTNGARANWGNHAVSEPYRTGA